MLFVGLAGLIVLAIVIAYYASKKIKVGDYVEVYSPTWSSNHIVKVHAMYKNNWQGLDDDMMLFFTYDQIVRRVTEH